MLYKPASDEQHDGLVVELVDTADLKSAARLGRDGSSPSEATMAPMENEINWTPDYGALPLRWRRLKALGSLLPLARLVPLEAG